MRGGRFNQLVATRVALVGPAHAGIAAFLATAVVLHCLRSDLDWTTTPLSFYLVGPYGAMLKIAYVALAMSIVVIGLQFRAALKPGVRVTVPAVLFCLASVALVATALADTRLPGHPLTWAGRTHAIAAPVAFLTVTLAMVTQAWQLHGNARWRQRFPLALGLAMICFIGLWLHAFFLDWPRGITQRGLILLIVGWLAVAGGWLRNE